MAIAGRVAMIPKGDYDATVTYQILDVVRYNDASYVAKKSSTGMLPTDTEYWMLMTQDGLLVDDSFSETSERPVQNKVVNEAIQNILNGTTPVGDTLKLGGKGASEYALVEQLTKHLLPIFGGTASENINIIDNYSADLPDGTTYEFRLGVGGASFTHGGYTFSGGTWHVKGTKIVSGYELQEFWRYGTANEPKTVFIYRTCINGAWQNFEVNATTADLDSAMNAYSYTLQRGATEEETDAILNSMHSSCTKDKMHYYGTVTSGVVHSVLKGWTWFVEGFYADAKYGWQKITTYTGGETGYFRVIYAGTWTPWVKNVDHYDLANYLPKTGGEVYNGINMIPLGVKGHGQASYIKYLNTVVGLLGYLGFLDKDTPVFATSTGSAYSLLHSGNVGSYALPINGGRILGKNNYPLEIQSSEDTISAIRFYNVTGATLGFLGFNGADNPYFYTSQSLGRGYSLHHDGNSRKVMFGTSAPSDTTVLWADTANKKMKCYIDGAWTALA